MTTNSSESSRGLHGSELALFVQCDLDTMQNPTGSHQEVLMTLWGMV